MQLPFYRVMCWIYEKNNYLLLRKSCSRYYNQEEDSEEINVINACRFWLKCQEYLYSLIFFPYSQVRLGRMDLFEISFSFIPIQRIQYLKRKKEVWGDIVISNFILKGTSGLTWKVLVQKSPPTTYLMHKRSWILEKLCSTYSKQDTSWLCQCQYILGTKTSGSVARNCWC